MPDVPDPDKEINQRIEEAAQSHVDILNSLQDGSFGGVGEAFVDPQFPASEVTEQMVGAGMDSAADDSSEDSSSDESQPEDDLWDTKEPDTSIPEKAESDQAEESPSPTFDDATEELGASESPVPDNASSEPSDSTTDFAPEDNGQEVPGLADFPIAPAESPPVSEAEDAIGDTPSGADPMPEGQSVEDPDLSLESLTPDLGDLDTGGASIDADLSPPEIPDNPEMGLGEPGSDEPEFVSQMDDALGDDRPVRQDTPFSAVPDIQNGVFARADNDRDPVNMTEYSVDDMSQSAMDFAEQSVEVMSEVVDRLVQLTMELRMMQSKLARL